MKICPNCHINAKDDALFCPVCGTTLSTYAQPDPDYFNHKPQQIRIPDYSPVPVSAPAHDHTADYTHDDINSGKLVSMIVYLLDFVGVIIALLMSSDSKYIQFHIRQSLKFTILEVLVCFLSLLLCWTVIVPILGILAVAVLMLVKFTCFLDVCNGKAKDAPIIRSIKFLN